MILGDLSFNGKMKSRIKSLLSLSDNEMLLSVTWVAQNIDKDCIPPNFLMCKFYGNSAETAFPQNFCTRKLGAMTAFYAVKTAVFSLFFFGLGTWRVVLYIITRESSYFRKYGKILTRKYACFSVLYPSIETRTFFYLHRKCFFVGKWYEWHHSVKWEWHCRWTKTWPIGSFYRCYTSTGSGELWVD